MLERVLQFAIERRGLVVFLTLALVALGVYSLQRLPIDAVPDITNKQVQINTEYAAFSPAEIEQQVTFPIETALAGIPGLESTRSLSRNGFSQVTAVFKDEVDIYFARQQVNERLGEARDSLPPGAEPIMGAISTGLGEAYMWSVAYTPREQATATDGAPGWQRDGSYVTSEGQRLSTALERTAYLRTVQDWIIRPQLKGLEGVAGVDAIGGYVKQYHVQPDPMKLVAYGLTFQDIIDEQDIAIHAMRIPSTSLTQATQMQLQVEKTLKAFPEVALVFSKTGTAEMASDPMPPHISDTFVMLKPYDEWPNPEEPKSALVERIEEALLKLPGNNYEFTQPIQMRFNELIAGVQTDVAVKVYGDRFRDMQQTAAAIARILQDVPGAADVKVEQTTGLPVLQIHVDRAAIARYGLSVADVQEVVAIAIGGKEAGLVFEGDRRFPLSVRLPEHLRQNLDTLKTLPVPLSHEEENGRRPTRVAALGAAASTPNRPGFIPLGELARLEVSEGPNQISRENGKRRVVVQANIRGRDLGSFVAEAQERIARELTLPSGSWLSWGGQFENLMAARQRLTLVVPGCFLLIFLLLYSALNSAKYALLVFTGVPLALTGGIVSLWLRDIPFSISAAVGFIALSGVAVLNGLVMVTYMNQLRREGAPLEQAVIQGALTRLRPVLMTALVASLGFVPMALATGTGAEVQKPLATVVIGGLVSSTLLTLVVLPALYRCFERAERAE